MKSWLFNTLYRVFFGWKRQVTMLCFESSSRHLDAFVVKTSDLTGAMPQSGLQALL